MASWAIEMKQLWKEGLDKEKKFKAESLIPEEKLLCEKGVLGDHDSEAVF